MTGAETHYQRAKRKEDEGDLAMAFHEFSSAIELDSTYAEAYLGRANIYAQHADYENAIADYTHAIELGVQDATVYFNRGSAHAQIGDFRAAIADFHAYLAVSGNELGMAAAVQEWIAELEQKL